MDRVTDPFTTLGVGADATDEQVRAAWLAAVRRHPPDRDPAGFKRAREAYELLSDGDVRVAHRLFGRPGLRTLGDLARFFEAEPRRAGFAPFRALLRERAP
jgi:curved DNA-binding protein CbpA